MIVKITTTEAGEYGDGESLEIDTPKNNVYFGDIEPEDASLARDLGCAYNIEDMIKEAYEAGKAGEELTFEYLEEEG